MNRAGTAARRFAIPCCIAVLLGACGGGDSGGAVDANTVVCGTHDDPGVLQVIDILPAPGSTVVNQGIAHGFTVVNAPAIFSNFTLLYGPTHTAGLSTPSDPTFQITESGSNLLYRLTVDSWSRAPSHVELRASGGYDTSKGCSWVFPSPLFSYDVTPVPAGDAGGEAGATMDGGLGPADVPVDISPMLDVPGGGDAFGAIDASGEIDVPIAVDGSATVDGEPATEAGAN
jgi:hypothetical protein